MCKAMEDKGTGFEKILEDYKNVDLKYKPFIFAKNNQFSIVLPDLTNKDGVGLLQQAIAQRLTPIYENVFSDYSYGFRPNKDCHTAMNKVLEYLNNGFEWVIDLDIEKYFDIVNHKLISILREQVNDSYIY